MANLNANKGILKCQQFLHRATFILSCIGSIIRLYRRGALMCTTWLKGDIFYLIFFLQMENDLHRFLYYMKF